MQVKWSGPELMNKPILFGDFMEIGDATVTKRIYKPIPDRNRLNAVLEEAYMHQSMGNTQVQNKHVYLLGHCHRPLFFIFLILINVAEYVYNIHNEIL